MMDSLMNAYETLAEIVRAQNGVIDRLFAALANAVEVSDEDLAAIRRIADLTAEAERKGYI